MSLKKFKYFMTMSALFLCLLPGITAIAGEAEFVPEIQPRPEYLPAEIVGIQMRALANNDKPFDNAGIDLAFRFASPTNKSQTGPIKRFIGIFNNPAFSPMINHKKLKVGQAKVDHTSAQVPILLTSKEGSSHGYMFVLHKQTEGEFANCWMTESVHPIQLLEENTPQLL